MNKKRAEWVKMTAREAARYPGSKIKTPDFRGVIGVFSPTQGLEICSTCSEGKDASGRVILKKYSRWVRGIVLVQP